MSNFPVRKLATQVRVVTPLHKTGTTPFPLRSTHVSVPGEIRLLWTRQREESSRLVQSNRGLGLLQREGRG